MPRRSSPAPARRTVPPASGRPAAAAVRAGASCASRRGSSELVADSSTFGSSAPSRSGSSRPASSESAGDDLGVRVGRSCSGDAALVRRSSAVSGGLVRWWLGRSAARGADLGDQVGDADAAVGVRSAARVTVLGDRSATVRRRSGCLDGGRLVAAIGGRAIALPRRGRSHGAAARSGKPLVVAPLPSAPARGDSQEWRHRRRHSCPTGLRISDADVSVSVRVPSQTGGVSAAACGAGRFCRPRAAG